MLYPSVSMMGIGIFLGAIWANISWGNYWSWDPKETWAAATWLGYLIYIHYRSHHASRNTPALIILIFAFLLLQMCWFGINYLPAAQGNSIHVYNM
jgi:ABC-type transport system involved in cytochrome c biogenesis permease subunit